MTNIRSRLWVYLFALDLRKSIKDWFLFFLLFLGLLCNISLLHAGQKDELDSYENIRRLTTRQAHVEALEQAVTKAQKTILVTSYGRLFPSLLQTDLFQNLLPAARQRNVRVYFRFNYDTQKESSYVPIHPAVQEYCDEQGINVAWVQTHAKIVAVDHALIMMGSFNWLTDLTYPYDPPLNSSLVYEGPAACKMIEHIWSVLKYYRNKKFGEYKKANHKKAYLFKRNPYTQRSSSYDLEDGSKLTYIPLIEEHRYKLLEIFQQAQQRIVIVSPFVSRNGPQTYQRDFVRELLEIVLKKNIEICFVCLPEEEGSCRFYLDPLLKSYSNLKFVSYPHLHAKTVIMDDGLIAEGSFNWLLAARDEVSPYHKHEATLACEGPFAREFIEDFYQTNLGRMIQSVFTLQSSPINNKRKRTEIEKASLPPHQQKRQRPSLPSTLEEQDFFSHRKEEVERDLWVHHPFWIQYSPGYVYLVYKKYFEIMSGEPFHQRGYCVRINKQYYLQDGSCICYFNTLEKAKKAAYRIWKGNS